MMSRKALRAHDGRRAHRGHDSLTRTARRGRVVIPRQPPGLSSPVVLSLENARAVVDVVEEKEARVRSVSGRDPLLIGRDSHMD